MSLNFDIAAYLGMPPGLLALILVWSLVWMGIALWIAARKKHIVWYVIFLLVHTLGILEILYIFVFSKMKLNHKEEEEKPVRKKRR